MKVIWTPEANQDRKDVQQHIASDNPFAAAKLNKVFLDATARLAEFPMLGQTGAVAGTRELIPHASYRILYQVDEMTSTIWILALLHTAQCWPPLDPSQN